MGRGDGHAKVATADDAPASRYREHALLAEEREDNQFYGFWTFDADVVDAILARLEAFPATEPA